MDKEIFEKLGEFGARIAGLESSAKEAKEDHAKEFEKIHSKLESLNVWRIKSNTLSAAVACVITLVINFLGGN